MLSELHAVWNKTAQMQLRDEINRLQQNAQTGPKTIGINILEQRFNITVALLPDGDRGCEHRSSLRGQAHPAAAPIGGVFSDGDQSAPLERFERGGEGGAIHGEESCD